MAIDEILLYFLAKYNNNLKGIYTMNDLADALLKKYDFLKIKPYKKNSKVNELF